jgi:hypothetical protein
VAVEKTLAGRATVRLPGGRRGEVPSEGLAFETGERALLMVRPERLVLAAEEPPPEGLGLPVTCTDMVFQGAVLRCALRSAEGGELVAYLEAARRDPAVHPGAALWLGFEPAAARLLHAEAEGHGTGPGEDDGAGN